MCTLFSGHLFLHLLCCLTLETLIKSILYIFALRHQSGSAFSVCG